MNASRSECLALIGPRSPTLTPCGVLFPPLAGFTPRPPAAPHGPKWRIRLPPRSWFLPGDLGKETSAGTAPRLSTVCFALSDFSVTARPEIEAT